MVSFNIYTLLTGISGINLISISIYCLIHKERRRSLTTIFLSLFCILLAMNFLYDTLTLNQVFGAYLRYLDEFSLLLAFPALYMYVLLLTKNRLELEWNYLLHTIPAIFFLLVWVFPPDGFLSWNRNRWMNTFYEHYNQLQFLFYIIVIFQILSKNDNVSKELTSTAENGNLKWIKQLLVFLSIIFLVWILEDAELINGNLIAIPILVFSYWLGYQTINQKDVYYNISQDFKIDMVNPIVRTGVG